MKCTKLLLFGRSAKEVSLEEFKTLSYANTPAGKLLLDLVGRADAWTSNYEITAFFVTPECDGPPAESSYVLSIHHQEFSGEPVLSMGEGDDLSLQGIYLAVNAHIEKEFQGLQSSIKTLEKAVTRLRELGNKLVVERGLSEISAVFPEASQTTFQFVGRPLGETWEDALLTYAESTDAARVYVIEIREKKMAGVACLNKPVKDWQGSQGFERFWTALAQAYVLSRYSELSETDLEVLYLHTHRRGERKDFPRDVSQIIFKVTDGRTLVVGFNQNVPYALEETL